MLCIGKGYLTHADGKTYLCADVKIGQHKTSVWFSVESPQEEYLCLGRADPFVMALLPAATRGGHEIICEDVMSARLHYQLCSCLIPSLPFTGTL